MDDAMKEAWDILFTRWGTEFSDAEGDPLILPAVYTFISPPLRRKCRPIH